MKTLSLNKQDRKIIRGEFKPIIFNILLFLIFGVIFIIVFPYIDHKSIQALTSENKIILQIILSLILLGAITTFFLNKTKVYRKEIIHNTKIGTQQKLIDKIKEPRENFIVYMPENIKDNNTYTLQFEKAKIVVNKVIWDKLSIGAEYILYYSPESKIFLNISDKNKNYYR